MELETDINENIFVRVDRTRKIPATVLIRALGYNTNARILDLFDNDRRIQATLEKDNTDSEEEALVEIYKRLRPGEPPTVDSARSLLYTLFFDPKRYDLGNVGRYKLNKKLQHGVLKRLSPEGLVWDEKAHAYQEGDGSPVADDYIRHLTKPDIIESFRYLLRLMNGGAESR